MNLSPLKTNSHIRIRLAAQISLRYIRTTADINEAETIAISSINLDHIISLDNMQRKKPTNITFEIISSESIINTEATEAEVASTALEDNTGISIEIPSNILNIDSVITETGLRKDEKKDVLINSDIASQEIKQDSDNQTLNIDNANVVVSPIPNIINTDNTNNLSDQLSSALIPIEERVVLENEYIEFKPLAF